MNLYHFKLQVLNSSDKRPTVRLIMLYRALHDCSLKQAKDYVEDKYSKEFWGRVNINFLVDDTALGRIMYAVHDKPDFYTRPDIERLDFDDRHYSF